MFFNFLGVDMATLYELLENLNKFEHIPAVKTVIQLSGGYSDVRANAEQIRTLLSNMFLDSELKNIKQDDIVLFDVADELLMMMARLFPLNTEDFVTFEPIDDKYCFQLSSGHQVDVRNLIEFDKQRMPKEEFGECKDNKLMHHLVTSTPLPTRDFKRVQTAAKALLGKEIKAFDKEHAKFHLNLPADPMSVLSALGLFAFMMDSTNQTGPRPTPL